MPFTNVVGRAAMHDQPSDDRLLSILLQHLREQSGIDFGQYKRATIVRRVQRRMAATRSGDLR